MKQILTLPNLLTGYRFLVVPFLLYLLQPDMGAMVGMAAFVLYLSAALTDLADGYIARRRKIETALGKLIDPLADKVLVAAALILLIPMDRVPAWVALVILARELMITGLRGVAAAAGVVVGASKLGKYKSVLQYTALCVLIYPEELSFIPHLHDIGTLILYVSVVLTIWSGIQYFFRFKRVYLPTTAGK
jgi:CDP-diacylglycerol---glycerol-3-phosphate 3-phosphatidyltransferase